MKFFIYLIAIFLNSRIYASSHISKCEIKLPHFLIYSLESTAEEISSDVLSKRSTCSKFNNQIVAKKLRGLNGEVPISYLKKLLEKNKQIKIISKNNWIHLDTLKSFIKKSIEKSIEEKVVDLKILKKVKVFAFHGNLNLAFPNETSISVISKNDDISKEVFKSKIDYKVYRNVLVSNVTIYPYSMELKKGDKINSRLQAVWKKDENLRVPPSTRLGNYQLTRILSPGIPLRKNDIIAKTVIQPGRLISVVLNQNGLLIKTVGVSQNSGKIGDKIEVKLKNNKIVSGKILLESEYYVKI